MKLYIQSVFDKETNKLEDAKQKAIEEANKVEAQHGNRGAAKLYYFALALNKLIIATGDIGKQAMLVDSNILAMKDIPKLQLGDIPTKFAKYQEVIIPAIDFKQKKVVFNRIKDMNEDDNIGAELVLTEIPNNNPVYDWEGHKIEIIDEQPKFLKITPSQTVNAKISFKLVPFFIFNNGGKFYSDYKITINGKDIVIGHFENYPRDVGVLTNNTSYNAAIKVLEFKGGGSPSGKGDHHDIIEVTLSGYFTEIMNIAIIGEEKGQGELAYIQDSLELEKIIPFEIPEPYKNVATKIDGVVHQPVTINKSVTDGITMGAIMTAKSASTNFVFFNIGDKNPKLERYNSHLRLSINGNAWDISGVEFPSDMRKPFYVQMSINLKTETATFTINNKSTTIDFSPFKKYLSDTKEPIVFGDKNQLNYMTNMWYWIGDTADIQPN